MSEDWSAVVADVAEGISEVGKIATLHAFTTSGPDHNPTITDVAPAPTLTVLGSDYKDAEVDGTLIQTGDRKLIVAAMDVTYAPSVEYEMTVDGVRYAIIDVRPLMPGDTVLMWKVQLRA